jgi:hypothetical protein
LPELKGLGLTTAMPRGRDRERVDVVVAKAGGHERARILDRVAKAPVVVDPVLNPIWRRWSYARADAADLLRIGIKTGFSATS